MIWNEQIVFYQIQKGGILFIHTQKNAVRFLVSCAVQHRHVQKDSVGDTKKNCERNMYFLY